MVSADEVKRALHVDEVDVEDLVELLTAHFAGARQDAPREIAFPTNGEAALRLVFSKDLGRIASAVAGPDLQASSLEMIRTKIERELLTSLGRRCGTVVAFSLQPVTGWWRYEERLQIRPLPPESPRPPFTYAANPLLLDFMFQAATDAMASGRRHERASTRWVQRLNVLVEPGIEQQDSSPPHRWVLIHEEDGRFTSKYLQVGYVPEGVTFDDKAIPRPTGDPIGRVDPQAYYTSLGVTSAPLTLPTSLDASVGTIERLPAEVLMRFDRAAYWYYYAGHQARARSVTAVALGAAVEALFEPDPKAPRCPTCQRELRGPTARFVEFMTAHLPSQDAESARRLFADLYGLRSKPAHGHVLETDFLPFPSFTPARLGEDAQVRALFSYVRIALVNWLDAQSVAN